MCRCRARHHSATLLACHKIGYSRLKLVRPAHARPLPFAIAVAQINPRYLSRYSDSMCWRRWVRTVCHLCLPGLFAPEQHLECRPGWSETNCRVHASSRLGDAQTNRPQQSGETAGNLHDPALARAVRPDSCGKSEKPADVLWLNSLPRCFNSAGIHPTRNRHLLNPGHNQLIGQNRVYRTLGHPGHRCQIATHGAPDHARKLSFRYAEMTACTDSGRCIGKNCALHTDQINRPTANGHRRLPVRTSDTAGQQQTAEAIAARRLKGAISIGRPAQ